MNHLWTQYDISRKPLYEILQIVMGYVDDADDIRIDITSIEQSLQDIEDKIEELAMEIEKGQYHEEVER
jgi:hypothetical protein